MYNIYTIIIMYYTIIIMYPVLSTFDVVINTLILFPISAASCNNLSTTREREWTKIVYQL